MRNKIVITIERANRSLLTDIEKLVDIDSEYYNGTVVNYNGTNSFGSIIIECYGSINYAKLLNEISCIAEFNKRV